MPRYLGIDYGEKRIGLSWGDELGLATPLRAAVEKDEAARWRRMERVIAEKRITGLVVGYPYNMDGSAGFKAREVDRFVEDLKARFSLPVHLVDERLTSSLAEERYRGRKKEIDRRSGEIDSHAAAVILQDFLNHRYPPPEGGAE